MQFFPVVVVGALACFSAGALASLRFLMALDKATVADLRVAYRDRQRLACYIFASDSVLGLSVAVVLTALHLKIALPSQVEFRTPDWPAEIFCALWAIALGIVVGSLVVGTKDVLQTTGLEKVPGAEATLAVLNVALWVRYRAMRSFVLRTLNARDRRLVEVSNDLSSRYGGLVKSNFAQASNLVPNIETYYEATGEQWDSQLRDLVSQWTANSETLSVKDKRDLLDRMCGRLARRRIYRPILSLLEGSGKSPGTQVPSLQPPPLGH